MENSNVKADIISHITCNKKEFFDDTFKLKKDFLDKINNCSFGDLIVITYEEQDIFYFIGKNGHLIENQPDDCNELVVPYEITQYLKDATNKYSELDYSGIYLRFDDQFLKKYLGDCQQEWNYRYLLLNDHRTLMVDYLFDNKKVFNHQFDILKITSQDIHNFYMYSFDTQFKFLVKYKFEASDYERFIDKYGDLFKHPQVPVFWTTEPCECRGGTKRHYGMVKYQGPLEQKNEVIQIIKDFYEGFEFEFIWVNKV